MSRPSFCPTPWSRVALMVLLAAMLISPAQAQYRQPPAPPPEDYGDDAEPSQYYAADAEAAMAAFRKGDYTQAITLLTKAIGVSPDNPALLNNLAASYIQRGVYYQNQKRDNQKAVDDYRMGLFYLKYVWPNGAQRSPGSTENLRVLQANLDSAYRNLNIPVGDAKWHLKSAWELRRQGRLPEALVEYAQVTDLNPKSSEGWLAQGDILTVRQQPVKALAAYQKAVQSTASPTDTAFVKLGTAELQSGNPEKAVDAFNKALSIAPANRDALLALEQVWKREIGLNARNMSAHINLGAVYQQMGRFDDARAQYEVAGHLAPDNPLIKLNLGSLYQAQGKLDQAATMYDAVLRQDPTNTRVLLSRADLARQMGQPQQAEALLQRAIQSAPDKKAVMNQLMAIYKAQNNPEKLAAGWRQYGAMFPQDAQVQYQAGLSAHEQKQYADAIGYYQKAVALKPDMAEAYANLGAALHAVNKDAEAEKALKKAIALDPQLEQAKSLADALNQQNASQALVQASQLYEAKRYADSAKAFEMALKADPNNPDVLSRYGLALQALKRTPQALAAYDKAIAKDPKSAATYYYRGTIYDEQNQIDKAKADYQKAIALDGSLDAAKQALAGLSTAAADDQLAKALAAYNKKSYSLALQLADEALKSAPNNATAYYYKGLVYDAQKKPAQAKMAYEKSVSLDPSNPDVVYALAVLLDTQNQKAGAKQNYQRFIELVKNQPEDDTVKYAKERVSKL